MIITRRLARDVRTVFARALGTSRRGAQPPLVLQAGPEGVTLQIQNHEVAIEYRLDGDFAPEQFAIPLAVRRQCEGTRQEPIQIERQNERTVLLRWTDGGVPQMSPVEVLEGEQALPAPPHDWTPNSPRLLTALADAVECTDSSSSRYALGCLQLRAAGEIAATDGRQLLLQSGFDYPWEEDLLVPASRVLGCRELLAGDDVEIGHSGDWVALRRGPWTVFLAVQKDARFPEIERVIPSRSHAATTVHFAVADLAFLGKSLKHLPAAKELNSPVTIDAIGAIAVRAQSSDRTQTTELVLSGSRREGEAVRVSVNREYLARAVRLGFRELQITTPSAPLLCQDEHRRYVAAVLDAAAAVKPSDDMLRVESGAAFAPPKRFRGSQLTARQLQAIDA